MKDFKKRVLILGGSSDIGIQLIQNLLEDNWKIVAHYSSRNDKLIIYFLNTNMMHLLIL